MKFAGTRSVTRHLATALALMLAVGLSVGCATDIVEGDDSALFPARDDSGPGEEKPLVPNDCDISGYWVAQFYGRNKPVNMNAEAVAWNWYYYELIDHGDEVEIVRGWDCGYQVCGQMVHIELSNEQLEMFARRNRQDGVLYDHPSDPAQSLTVAPRDFIFKKQPDGTCYFEMSRWWWLRSAGVDKYPDREDFESMDIQTIQAQNPLPLKGVAANQHNDWDGDGTPGVMLSIDKPGGSRSSAQRDWNEFGPGIVPDGSQDFIVPAEFDNEEVNYFTSNPLLDAISIPIPGRNNVRFVKVDTPAPEDIPGFRQYCQDAFAEHFRHPSARNNCTVIEQQTPEESKVE